MMADSSSRPPPAAVYVAVSNIPAQFRSADLRNFFSQFIESGGFRCFHYRHRPEVLRGSRGVVAPDTDTGPSGESSPAAGGHGSGPPETPDQSSSGPPETPDQSHSGSQKSPDQSSSGPPESPDQSHSGSQKSPDQSCSGPLENPDQCCSGPQKSPDQSSSGPPESPDQSHSGPQKSPDQSCSGPPETPDQSSSGPPETPDQSCSGPQKSPDQSCSGSQMSPDQSCSGPQKSPDQSCSGPPGSPDQSSSGPQKSPDQSSSGPLETPDQSSSGPQKSPDQSSSGPPETPDQSCSGPPETPDQSHPGPPETPDQSHSGPQKSRVRTCCCVVSVVPQHAERLVRMYSGTQWVDSKGSWLAGRCVIKRVKVSHGADEEGFPYRTKREQRHRVAPSERFSQADLDGLPELNPPALMQNGNVGTPVTVFLQLIQSCRLPPRLIRKLGLTFPKTSSNRRYGNVPYQYWDTFTVEASEDHVYTAAGHEVSGPGGVASGPRGVASDAPRLGALRGHQEEEEEEEEEQSNADDEWERHEALHDDVTSQDRCKERLFEEEIELKWEKGGSGLVFYTDAQYWQEEEGDFDEQTTDDWDVDMSVYYDKDGGDMDARDYVCMRYEKRLRDGLEDRSGHTHPIGRFERFTKGFGRRVMEQQGWKDGHGLGRSRPGIPDALESDGQHPNCKRGFGYHGEKLTLNPVKRPRAEHHISTVYDAPRQVDQYEPLLRRQPSTSMKYREWQRGGTIGPRR
ncbi:hypothetical protein CRUP_000265 [Coryphaenoides rupestris]|nr:hypothetical protein CRUP_000265 [Coryphaenoides rupestris]